MVGTGDLRKDALLLLRRALDDETATFREGQFEAIEALVREGGRHLVVQRTGWGKTIVYFLATRLFRDAGHGVTIVVSPLLSLMRNQIEAATRIGLRAGTINSSNRAEWAGVVEGLENDAIDVLFVTPERLANEEFRDRHLLAVAARCPLLVVDEAHCISDWGHDFRPDYQRVARVVQLLPPQARVLATTATANDRVVEDIGRQLGPQLRLQRGSLARKSLRLQNLELPSRAARFAWLAEHLPSLPGSGIVYTLTRRDAVMVSGWLRHCGIEAQAYLGASFFNPVLEQRLLANEVKCLVATTALGMGFDKPDLGFVVHFQRPASVVHYYQQVGRAGRAVDEAYGILLGGAEDDAIADYFIRTAFPSEQTVARILSALDEAEDEGLTLAELERRVNAPRGKIEHALKWLGTLPQTPVRCARVSRSQRDGTGGRRQRRQVRVWCRTPVVFRMPHDRIAWLAGRRRREQLRMQEYLQHDGCLMAFLQAELDDAAPSPCGRCARCLGRPLVPETFERGVAERAVAFLRRAEIEVSPRKAWPARGLEDLGFRGRIPPSEQAEPGVALCHWSDPAWGVEVRRGKLELHRFSDELVEALVALVRRRQPQPAPRWVTCVTSTRTGALVPDLARRVAGRLGLPFVEVVRRRGDAPPQKLCENSVYQARNAAEAFSVEVAAVPSTPVLLVDDVVDSGWTVTVVAALLRRAGAGPVHPVFLADCSSHRVPALRDR
ncbi:MAG: RecQ family ATP-dependent DNA helicase [Planctomycetota bacterium]|nr:MAG: RecQ family ATP-dependent DNA helicase [Planctomycetota bacterium]